MSKNLTGERTARIEDEERLKKMILYMQQNYDKKLQLDDIAQAANISRRESARCFRKLMNHSPMDYLNIIRIEAAAEHLVNTADSITRIGEECGFASGSYFTSVFHKTLGITPKDYRRARK